MKLISILVAIFNLLVGNSIPSPSVPSGTIPSPTMKESQKIIAFGDESYAYTFFGPVKPENVILHSNLPEKKTSEELYKQYSCTSLINGGFYGKNDQPIGLFLTDGIVRHEQLNSALFNGFIAQTTDHKGVIANILPDTDLIFSLQTGPVLMEESSTRTLKLIEDEHARRMIGALDTDGNFYFFSIFSLSNDFGGPLLEELPSILTNLAKSESITLSNAINLDGGNHSAFYGKSIQLTELSPIGSFFCIK